MPNNPWPGARFSLEVPIRHGIEPLRALNVFTSSVGRATHGLCHNKLRHRVRAVRYRLSAQVDFANAECRYNTFNVDAQPGARSPYLRSGMFARYSRLRRLRPFCPGACDCMVARAGACSTDDVPSASLHGQGSDS